MKNDANNVNLDTLIESERAQGFQPSDELMGRIMADAELQSMAPKGFMVKDIQSEYSGFKLLKFLPSLSGLAACAIIGGYFGYNTSSDVFFETEIFEVSGDFDLQDDFALVFELEEF